MTHLTNLDLIEPLLHVLANIVSKDPDNRKSIDELYQDQVDSRGYSSVISNHYQEDVSPRIEKQETQEAKNRAHMMGDANPSDDYHRTPKQIE